MSRWTYSPEVLAKAARYRDGGHVKSDPTAPGVYWVQGSAKAPYRVQTDADPVTKTASWITCTCRHGGAVGAGSARCSHAVSVLLTVRDA